MLTSVDLLAGDRRSRLGQIARDLGSIAYQLSRHQSVDKVVERLSAVEEEEVRRGVEAAKLIGGGAGWRDAAAG